jgi:hypothetical protein
MTDHLGVLPVGLTVANTIVKGDVDGEPPGGAVRSPAAATTDVVRRCQWRAPGGATDGSGSGNHRSCKETLMAGPL